MTNNTNTAILTPPENIIIDRSDPDGIHAIATNIDGEVIQIFHASYTDDQIRQIVGYMGKSFLDGAGHSTQEKSDAPEPETKEKVFSLELNAITKLIFDLPGVCDVKVVTTYEPDELVQLEVEDDYRNTHEVSVAKLHGEWVIWVPSIESPLPLNKIDNYLFNLAASQLGVLRRENA